MIGGGDRSWQAQPAEQNRAESITRPDLLALPEAVQRRDP